jgi:serine/threonine protein kinase
LIDFGFAEKINSTKLVNRSGTPGFLPPELFKLHPFLDKGDVFALGVMLFCMLTGNSCFKASTHKEVLQLNK